MKRSETRFFVTLQYVTKAIVAAQAGRSALIAASRDRDIEKWAADDLLMARAIASLEFVADRANEILDEELAKANQGD